MFPVFLKLHQTRTLIVGGGNVGLEKLEALLKNDSEAQITLIAPEISDKIRTYAAGAFNIRLLQREYRMEDLASSDLAILATNSPALHREIREHASAFRVLLNVADTPDLCDFYLGSTVKRGDLKIGISTNGKSPTFAKRFRQLLEESVPEETEELLEILKKFRDRLDGDFSEKVKTLNQLTKTLVD